MQVAHLCKIDPDANNNRVYIMTDLGNGSFQVEYGRVGVARMMKKEYPMSFWKEILNKHLAEGYIDRTAEFNISAKTVRQENGYAPIENEAVADFVNFLLVASKRVVQQNYTVEHDQVSKEMIEAAQDTIFRISQSTDLNDMRELYKALFVIIPRKMKDVAAALPSSLEEGYEKLLEEQSLLDALKTVKQESVRSNISQKTILDTVGLRVREVTDLEKAQIKKHLTSESAHLYKRAFRVENIRTEERFREYCKAHGIYDKYIHYYYHGSGNANYWGIATEGLLLNPKAPITGKMFGYGLYFAPRARKSIGYTSLQGSYWRHGGSDRAYLAVFKVAFKNPSHTQTCHGYTRLHHAPKGHDAVFAHAGVELYNDEVIVYNEAQCTIQYLIEIGK